MGTYPLQVTLFKNNNNNLPLFLPVRNGVFRNGVWSRNYHYDGTSDVLFQYGITGNIPVAGDWTGIGKDTVGVFRNRIFYFRNSNTAGFADLAFTYGTTGDIPVTGDWI